MLLNEAFLFHLTPKEKQRYEDLFVIRQEAKNVMKVFRKEYNTLKSNIKKLEMKYGKSSEFVQNGHRMPEIDQTKNNILGNMKLVETKYYAIEHALMLSKERQKYFTKLLHKFPFDSIRQTGSASRKITDLLSYITSSRDMIEEARHGVSIANKYFGNITRILKWESEKKLLNKVNTGLPISNNEDV